MSVVHANKTPGPFSGWTELPRKIVVLEVFERLILFSLFVHFVNNMLGKGAAVVNMAALLIVLSETLPILLVMSRGPSESLSQRPSDWIFGVAGTSMPLLVISSVPDPLSPGMVCVLLMFAGISIQIGGKLFLGRSFGIVAANRGVKAAGPYRFVRHPIYAGYTLTHIGFLLFCPIWQNLLVYTVGLAFHIVRIMREERVLSQDPAYRDLMRSTPYRMLPGVF